MEGRAVPTAKVPTPSVPPTATVGLDAEWNNNAAGLVSSGGVGGARAAERLRLICGAPQMADVPQQVTLSLLTEFENHSIFKPDGDNAHRAGHAAGPGRRLEHRAGAAARRVPGRRLNSRKPVPASLRRCATGGGRRGQRLKCQCRRLHHQQHEGPAPGHLHRRWDATCHRWKANVLGG
jgi:hypothetical protein